MLQIPPAPHSPKRSIPPTYARVKPLIPIASSFVVNALILILNFIGGVVLARALEPAGRGEVAILLLWPLAIMYIASVGLPDTAAYFASQHFIPPQSLNANIILLVAAISAATLPISFVVLKLLSQQSTFPPFHLIVLYLIVLVPFGLLGSSFSRVLQGQQRFLIYNCLRLIIPLGSALAYVLLYAISAITLGSIVAVQIALQITNAALAFSFASRGDLCLSSIDIPLLKNMVSYGLRIHPGSVGQLANVKFDQLVLANFATAAVVGIYVAASNASSMLLAFAYAFQILLLPKLASLVSVNDKRVAAARLFRRFWWINLLLGMLGLLLIGRVLVLVYGQPFSQSVRPAELLVVAGIFLGSKQVLVTMAAGLGDPWLGSRTELFSTGILLGGVAVLAPTHGATGAALASVGSAVLGTILLLVGLRNRHQIKILDLFWVPLGTRSRTKLA